MDEPWRDLRVGDQVKIVRLPSWYGRSGYVQDDVETITLYQLLIDTQQILVIKRVDE